LDDLLLVIALISIAIGIYFLIKKRWKNLGIAFLVFLISFIGFGMTTDTEETAEQSEVTEESETETQEENNQEDQETQEAQETDGSNETQDDEAEQISNKGAENGEQQNNNTTEDQELQEADNSSGNQFEVAANEIFGDNLEEVQVVTGIEEIPTRVNIEFQIAENLTNNMMFQGLQYDVINFAELVQDEEFEELYYVGKLDMQDQYGNIENRQVANIALTKETVNQIEFDNFVIENLEDIADTFEVHNALRE